MNDEVDEKISDIRNGLKLYSGRYRKGVREVLRSDKHQDEIFRNRLRFSFMKNWNISQYIDSRFQYGYNSALGKER